MFITIVGGFICLCFIISIFNPFEIYRVSHEAYFILFSGFCSYIIGLLPKRCKKDKIFKRPLDYYGFMEKLEAILRLKRFWVLYLFSLGLIAYLAMTQWTLILIQGGAGDLKLDMFELLFNNNSIMYFAYRVIVFPMFYFCTAALPLALLNKGNRKTLLLLVVFTFLFCFVGGKRGYWAIVIQSFVIVFLVVKCESLKLNLITWFKYISVGLVVVITLAIPAAYMTSIQRGRGIEGDKDGMMQSMVENAQGLITYNVGPFRAFDYAINNNYIEKAGGYTLGRATLGGGIDYYGAEILNRLGFSINRVFDNTLALLQDTDIYIGKHSGFNYSYTALMYFYFDFGYIGVILFAFLFGRFCIYCLTEYNKYRTIGSLLLVIYLVNSSLLMLGTWFNASISAQPILLLFFMIHKYELKKMRSLI